MEIIQATAVPSDFSKIEKAVELMEGLETLPAVAQRLLSLTADPNASFQDIEQLISADAALTSRVLQIAASPLYGGQAAKNLQSALVRLGLREVRNLALATSVSAKKTDDFQRGLWRHSLGCAVLAETLGNRLGKPRFQEPFVCALLHELGTLVLVNINGPVYKTLVGTIGGAVQAVREQQLLGFTHCDIGALAAERWRLFDGLSQAIQFHHEPLTAEVLDFPDPVLATIRLVALTAAVLSDPDAGAQSDMASQMLARLGTDHAVLQEELERAQPRIDEYSRMIGA